MRSPSAAKEELLALPLEDSSTNTEVFPLHQVGKGEGIYIVNAEAVINKCFLRIMRLFRIFIFYSRLARTSAHSLRTRRHEGKHLFRPGVYNFPPCLTTITGNARRGVTTLPSETTYWEDGEESGCFQEIEEKILIDDRPTLWSRG